MWRLVNKGSCFLRAGAWVCLLAAFVPAAAVGASEDEPSWLPCDREMRKVHEALQAWRRTHDGNYPDRLVDLVAAGLMPYSSAICPQVRAEAALADARHDLSTSRQAGADPESFYEYELSPNIQKSKDEARWLPPGSRAYTRRDIKLELLRRPHADQVPILRCSSHRAAAPAEWRADGKAWRNLTVTGEIYWSEEYWEKRWLADVPYCARESIVLFGLKGPPFYVDAAPTVAAALDLRSWSCAFGDHPWWWTVPLFDEPPNSVSAPHLRPFFQEQHARVREVGGEAYWLNGLTQLQGKISPNEMERYRQSMRQSFVWERTGLQVGRLVRKATWLQGTLWEAKPGEVAGELVWHYADGTNARVPLVYGKTTARFWADRQQLKTEKNFPEAVWQQAESAREVGKERVLRLYQQAWANPRPEVTVTTLDFVSNRASPAGPFVVAINVFP